MSCVGVMYQPYTSYVPHPAHSPAATPLQAHPSPPAQLLLTHSSAAAAAKVTACPAPLPSPGPPVHSSPAHHAQPSPARPMVSPAQPQLASPAQPMTSPAHPIVSPHQQLSSPAHHLSSPAHQLTSPAHHLSSSAQQLSSPAHQLSSPAHLVPPLVSSYQDQALSLKREQQLDHHQEKVGVDPLRQSRGYLQPEYPEYSGYPSPQESYTSPHPSPPAPVSSPSPPPPHQDGESDGESESVPVYLSRNVVLYTHYSGDVAAVVDTHFTKALNQASFQDSKGTPMVSRNLPPSFFNANYHVKGMYGTDLYSDYSSSLHHLAAHGATPDPWQYAQASSSSYHRSVQDLVQSQYTRNSQYSSLFLNSARLPVKSEAPWSGVEYHHAGDFSHALGDRSYAGHPYSNMAAASGLEASSGQEAKDLYWPTF